MWSHERVDVVTGEGRCGLVIGETWSHERGGVVT